MSIKSIFFPSKHKEASEHISIESPESAINSITWLDEEWSNAKTRDKKRRLKQYATLAGNRAKTMLKRKNLSQKERTEMKEIYGIYRQWVETHCL